MLKATSLFYSLILMLLIGALLTVLVLVTSTSKVTLINKEIENDLLDLTQSSESFALVNYLELEPKETQINPFGNELNFSVEKEIWGMFELMKCKSYVKNDTLKKTFIVGKKEMNDFAVYAIDNDKPLLIGGNAKIIGNAVVPNEGIKKLNLTRKNMNNFSIEGSVLKSKKVLPKARYKKNIPINEGETFSYENLDKRNLTRRTFFQEASVILLNQEELSNIEISGKYIIKSDGTIRITKSAKLEDVIIQSPRVIVESGFKGSIQVFATESVLLEKDVLLSYPSFIAVETNTIQENTGIFISRGSRVLGGVSLLSNQTINSKSKITIEEKVNIAGDLYTNASIELKGTVYGTVYTHSFYLNTGEAEYENAILNGVMNGNLPDEFVRINFVESTSLDGYKIIKAL